MHYHIVRETSEWKIILRPLNIVLSGINIDFLPLNILHQNELLIFCCKYFLHGTSKYFIFFPSKDIYHYIAKSVLFDLLTLENHV